MRKLIIIFLLSITALNCKKEQLEEQSGLLKDYTGTLDGCGFLIELDNGSKLEPVSNQSGVTFENNRRIIVKYRLKQTYSICQAGQGVEIVSLRYL
jgi:hypothetical protein